MKICIAAATQFEIQPIIDFLQGRDFSLQSHTVEIKITGIGSVATAYGLSKLIYEQRPDYIVQAGIAGTFTKKFQREEVVIIKDDVMGDLGVEEDRNFRDIFDLGLMDPSAAPFTHKRLENPHVETYKKFNLPFASGITVNEITTNTSRIKLLVEKYDCEIESMEGAACHYVCLMEKVPFIQLRAVSNYIGDREKKNWKIRQAIENLNQNLINIIQQIFSA